MEAMSETKSATTEFCLDGKNLSWRNLYRLGHNENQTITISDESIERIKKAKNFIDAKVAGKEVMYGITTGFGGLAETVVEDPEALQVNLIRSHACGVGNAISNQLVRMMMIARINTFLGGYSGVALSTVETLLEMVNSHCYPFVPEKGSVGASGDLAPLSHCALGMLGEGKMMDDNGKWELAADVLARHNIKPVNLGPKEGLALINGTQFICSYATKTIQLVEKIMYLSSKSAAMSLEALGGRHDSLDARIHCAKNHIGQMSVAAEVRTMLEGDSDIRQFNAAKYPRNQDFYSLRCLAQVQGPLREYFDVTSKLLDEELNSATDNPLILGDDVISCGNFHGQYMATAMDSIVIPLQAIAQISQSRTYKLTSGIYELKPFLAKDPGVQSGYMILQYVAAALTSENKVLSHPSSSDSIMTSAGQEDHVSMGAYSARKAFEIAQNTGKIIAIEFICALKALQSYKLLPAPRIVEMMERLEEYVPETNEDICTNEIIEAVFENIVVKQWVF